MESIISLLQTLLWVGLIAAITFRYHKIIENLLTSLHQRIDSGSGIKAGPFEIKEILKPQDAAEQAQTIQEEVAQIVQAEQSEAQRTHEPIANHKDDLRSQYLRAEDLALRKIQSEFGEFVSRQMQLSSGLRIDGAFVKDNTLNIVEIKYARRRLSRMLATQAVDRILSRIKTQGWKRVHIVLVVVYENAEIDLRAEELRLSDAVSREDFLVLVKCFLLSELEKEFGL